MNIGALTIFQRENVKFPNGESVEDYVIELSAYATKRLEYMTYEHERKAMDRYMDMYNKYFAGTSRRALSAQTFASPSYVKQFAYEYAEAEGLDDDATRMSSKTSESILHFLFVYYFSYHEAEETLRRKIKLVSFSTWFDRLRTKLGRTMRKEMEAREKAYAELSGRRRDAHVRKLKEGKRTWVNNWTEGSSDTMRFEEMKHIVIMSDFSLKKWWNVFKIPSSRIQVTGASDVRHEVLRKFRIWSRYMHPDKRNNRGLGLPFQHRLAQRFLGLIGKKAEMETWFANLAIEVD